MEVMGTPRAPAFSQSTSIRYSGTSSMPLGRTAVNLGSLAAMPRSWLLGLHQGLLSETAPVQQLEVEPLGHAQLDDGRRREGKDHGVADTRKGHHGPSRNGLGLQVRPVAELPVLQLDEHHAVVLCPSGKADAGNGHAGFHRLFFVLLK